MSSIQVKFFIGNEIRRLTLSTKTNYEEIVKRIHEFCLNQNPEIKKEEIQSLVFKYQDIEEDWVSFSSNEEWKEALVNFKDVLKIKVQKRHTKGTKPHHQHRHGRPQQCAFFSPFNFEQMFQQTQKPKEQQETGFENIFADILDEIQKESKKECNFDFSSFLNQENIEKAKKFVQPFIGDDFTKVLEEIAQNIQQELEKEQETQQEQQEEQPKQQEEEKVEEEIVMDDELYETKEEVVEYPKAVETVIEEKVEYPKVEEESKQVKVDSHEEKVIGLLNQMGFTQDSVNRYLLKKHNGDVQKVVSELLNQ